MLTAIWVWLTAPEQWSGTRGIPNRVLEHLGYSALALAIAAAIAIPLGLWVGHSGRAQWIVTATNAARAVPSLVVLVLLAIPPLVSGAYAGVRAVDPAVRDAAYGMGMRPREVLRQVEVPCALPLVLSGARAATLQVIATATIAAAVSLGGLGRYLIDGLAVRDYAQMAGGAVVVALLALVVDIGWGLLTRYAVSPGLSGRAAKPARGKHPAGEDVGRHDAPATSSAVLPTGSEPR